MLYISETEPGKTTPKDFLTSQITSRRNLLKGCPRNSACISNGGCMLRCDQRHPWF